MSCKITVNKCVCFYPVIIGLYEFNFQTAQGTLIKLRKILSSLTRKRERVKEGRVERREEEESRGEQST